MEGVGRVFVLWNSKEGTARGEKSLFCERPCIRVFTKMQRFMSMGVLSIFEEIPSVVFERDFTGRRFFQSKDQFVWLLSSYGNIVKFVPCTKISEISTFFASSMEIREKRMLTYSISAA